MNFAPLDWMILASVYVVLVGGMLVAKRQMKSVADFLAAGRTAGRYLLSVSGGISAVGAITIVAFFEGGYEAGFTQAWWGQSMGLVILILTLSGWVIYRFRRTRCLTLPEFFERRYSRSFRIFAGVLSFVSGLINFGIFPAVGARFFLYFCGLPQIAAFTTMRLPAGQVPGVLRLAAPEIFRSAANGASYVDVPVGVPVYPLLMLVLLGTALWFVYAGGQVAVIVTDFLQGVFANIVFLAIPVYLLLHVGWTRIHETISTRPPGRSFINAFDTGSLEDFNFWYFLIGVAGLIYNAMSWQGTQAYNTSATSAHEAKMGGVLSSWRDIPRGVMLTLVPVIAYTVLRHQDFGDVADNVNTILAGAGSQTLQNQLRVPVVLTQLLPVGLIGAFGAMMLAAFISTHDTYLHSWASIFVQDVWMPIRRKELTREEHLAALRWAILGVAIFIFCFSLFFQQNQHILLFFAVTGAIFVGGSGAVIIGGLYWRRGTNAGAWCALVTGATVAVFGVLHPEFTDDPWLNGQEFWALAMGASSVVYVVVSLLTPKPTQDIDQVLRRGAYELEAEHDVQVARPPLAQRIFGVTSEFSRRDKVLYVVTICWSGVWIATFVFGTILYLTAQADPDSALLRFMRSWTGMSLDFTDAAWALYWEVYMWIQVAVAAIVIIWFTTGGILDLRRMMRALREMQRDDTDDGMVRVETQETPE